MTDYRADHAEMRRLAEMLANGAKQRGARDEDRSRAEAARVEALASTGLALAMDGASHSLSMLEEARAAADGLDVLDGRLRGIEADGSHFASDPADVWSELGGRRCDPIGSLRASSRSSSTPTRTDATSPSTTAAAACLFIR